MEWYRKVNPVRMTVVSSFKRGMELFLPGENNSPFLRDLCAADLRLVLV